MPQRIARSVPTSAKKRERSAALEVVLGRDQDLLPHADRIVVRLASHGLVVGNRCQAGLLDVDGDAAALLGEGDLDAYVTHWNTTRRQVKLKGLTPAEYRDQALREAA